MRDDEEDRLRAEDDARDARIETRIPMCEACGSDLRPVEIDLGMGACEKCARRDDDDLTPFERAYRLRGVE